MSDARDAGLVAGQQLADVQPYSCRRCAKTLGMLAPGRFWLRLHGRTVIVEGGTVRVFCERCHAEHSIVLDNA